MKQEHSPFVHFTTVSLGPARNLLKEIRWRVFSTCSKMPQTYINYVHIYHSYTEREKRIFNYNRNLFLKMNLDFSPFDVLKSIFGNMKLESSLSVIW